MKELEPAQEYCTWKENRGDDDVYETSCKNTFYFDGASLEEQQKCGFKYCPYCRNKIRTI